MATEILMPRQGNTVESCLILEWRKQEGDTLHAGDVLCEVETDKATFEVEAESDGTLLKLLFDEGADVPVLTPIALIGQADEEVGALPHAAESAAELEEYTEHRDDTIEASATGPQVTMRAAAVSTPVSEKIGISPRARHLAAAKGIDVATLSASGPEGRIIERDVLAALAQQAPLTPTAVAALIAEGANVPAIGSGIGGRILADDVHQTALAPEMQVAAAKTSGRVTEIPVKGVRKIIANRMLESLQTTAQLTLNASADATRLLAYRKRLKAAPEAFGLAGVSINDLVLYAVARTLPRFPNMNAHFLGETIRRFEAVHLGVAVDTPRGLMVPCVKNAERLSLKALSAEAKRLASDCREGKILPDELSGGTFTVTNLGALGIEHFTPVLNPPEVGILGVCAIQPKAVMVGEDAQFIPHLGLSLTFDHRAVDGSPAAVFLKEFSHAISNIDVLLAG